MMIPLKFALYFGASRMTYLRYVTFLTLRHFHPNASIELHVPKKYAQSGDWGGETQDYLHEHEKRDYFPELVKLNVTVVQSTMNNEYSPVYQSDFFRWWWLSQSGGIYLDTDQVILKPFDTLPLQDNDFIYSAYPAKMVKIYYPVGVLCAAPDCEIVPYIRDIVKQYYNANVYNSCGPDMMRSVLFSRQWRDTMFNAPPHYFYPVPESYLTKTIYSGQYKPIKEAYAMHWFGGHQLSQRFNMAFTEGFAKNSNDSISVFLRENKLV